MVDMVYGVFNFSNDVKSDEYNDSIIQKSYEGYNQDIYFNDGGILGSNSKLFNNNFQNMIIEENVLSKLKSGDTDNYNIFIQFDKSIQPIKRINILKEIVPNVNIKYNYNLISVVNLVINSNDFEILINNGYFLNKIIKITENHHTNIKSHDDNTYYGLSSNWTSPFSYENWWLDSIGMNNVNYTGKNVKLAIMDTGISVHPDFFTNGNSNKPRIIASKNFTTEEGIKNPNFTYDSYGHGTHCAGIAGGNGYLSNGKYRGVAPEVELINAKISNSSGYIGEAEIIAGIEWCMNKGAQIISMSFGSIEPEVWNMQSMAIQEAVKKGVIVVSSIGNSGPEFFTAGNPGTALYSISVGATDINNHIAEFSSIGPSYTNQIGPDISAPGVNIISTDSKNSYISQKYELFSDLIDEKNSFGYVPLTGTSMSCPMVAGAVAILLDAFPESTPESIRNALIMGASAVERLTPEGYGLAQGAGLINVSKSIEYLSDIKKNKGSENNQVKIFPRVLPYAPFDFLRFPGNYQEMNYTIYSGREFSFNITFPNLEGIEFSTINQTFSLDSNSLISFPIGVKILYNSSIGRKQGYVEIVDNLTLEILDQIPIDITVAFPKAKILFETYHGMNDYYVDSAPIYSQIEFYHSMYDLQLNNYSIHYSMENWTAGYNSAKDGTIINPQLLSNIDILILQPPIIPYSEYEIKSIAEFYNNGGSILFLGTKYQNMCYNSINELFTNLNVDIAIKENNIFDIDDKGLYATAYFHLVNDTALNAPIFEGVDNYLYWFGNTFTIGENSKALAKIGDEIIATAFDGFSENKGRFVALGDYHTFKNTIYNNNYEIYGNNSRFLLNIMDYLKNQTDISISIDINNRENIDNNINFSCKVFDNVDKELKMSYANGSSINATLTYSNGTEKSITLTNLDGEGIYHGSIQLTSIDISNSTLKLECRVFDIQNYSKVIEFFYYPNITDNYHLISDLGIDINRSENENYKLYVSTNGTSLNLKPYIGITTGTFLSKNPISELEPQINSTSSLNMDYEILLPNSGLSTAGRGYIYCFSNDSLGYIDLTPDRYTFQVINQPPILHNSSSFGSMFFSSDNVQNNIPIPVLSNVPYLIELNIDDDFDFDSKYLNYSVFCTLIPIFVSNGEYEYLQPIEYPDFPLTYVFQENNFQGVVKLPDKLVYSVNNEYIDKSMETDYTTYLSILFISIRDLDGGVTNFPIFLYIYNEEPIFFEYYPIVLFVGLLGIISAILINGKKLLKK